MRTEKTTKTHISLVVATIFSPMLLLASGCAESKPNNVNDSQLINNIEAEEPVAKNIVLFIVDGMGISTVTAARIFDGQTQGLLGEEHALAFEDFEDVALIKTYNVNAQVPDSAGTATAMLSGYKANIGQINIEPGETLQGCGDIAGKPTLAQTMSGVGKSVGIISTARITHATPAAVYGYADSRDWEADKDIPDEANAAGCLSLAAQLVATSTPINLALGGGRKEFSEAQLNAWTNQGPQHVYASTGADFAALSPADGQDVLALMNDSHLHYEADRAANSDEPSLAEMTSFAIDNLASRDTDGYVLMVEAGRVDHAHHGTNAYRALTDMQALNEAVKVAKAKTGDDTLILVTADHSHVFTMAGYPVRGNPILGLVKPVDYAAEVLEDDPSTRYTLAQDGKPYTTLGYHNGGNVRTADSPALTDNDVQSPDFRQQTAVPLRSETHAGEDVPLYARGPGSHHVRGVMDQNEIHDVMLKAVGIE